MATLSFSVHVKLLHRIVCYYAVAWVNYVALAPDLFNDQIVSD